MARLGLATALRLQAVRDATGTPPAVDLARLRELVFLIDDLTAAGVAPVELAAWRVEAAAALGR
jgi:hypothetical protein